MGDFDVIIIGAGPAGIFTALELDKLVPDKRVLLIDSGSEIDKRICPARRDNSECVNCDPCNIMNGWAGAGAFSDGKLSLSPEIGGNVTDYISLEAAKDMIKYADDTYLSFGAPHKIFGKNDKFAEKLSYEAHRHNIKLIPCPVRHMGTEYSFEVLKKMYDYLKGKENFKFLDHTTAEQVKIQDNKVQGVLVYDRKGNRRLITANYVVAAPGRGGASWLSEVANDNGITVMNNEVDVGVRVEIPNAVMDHITKNMYEAKLVYYSDTFENKVRTFCMNPGGLVSEEHYDGEIAVVNGHSYAENINHTENTNFAMLVSTKFTSPFKEPIEYGKYVAKLGNMLTGGGIMVQRLGDLVQGRRTDLSRLKKSTTIPSLKTAVPGDLSFVLPHRHLMSIVEAIRAFDKLIPGVYSKNTLLYGVEVKFYSSKVKVSRDLETDVANFYAIGDGAGITRGLMQASVTGVIVARSIAKKIKHLHDIN